jgi:hypothetical protein
MGPYEANELGRLKIPTPMMLPMIRATAWMGPKRLSGGLGTAVNVGLAALALSRLSTAPSLTLAPSSARATLLTVPGVS